MMHRKNWWKGLLLVFVASAVGVVTIGVGTYRDAPPIPDFVTERGDTVVSHDAILRGQVNFQRLGLMELGSMFGDGAGRGPDFTADALHRVALSMRDYYVAAGLDPAVALSRMQQELKANRYDKSRNAVTLTDAQAHAVQGLAAWYTAMFQGTTRESMKPAGLIEDPKEIADLAAFFYWGSWVCAAQRVGETYSYTHNWPFDEFAGNRPSAPVMLWSVLGSLGLILGLGIVLYVRGVLDRSVATDRSDALDAPATLASVGSHTPTPTQRAAYKFFGAAAVVFVLQVIAGVLTIHDFVGLTTFFGYDLSKLLPITVVRSWHLQLSLYWISACWMGASIYIMPHMTGTEPKGQLALVNTLFAAVILLVVGSTVGIFLGPKGYLGEYWHALGNQGWEFVELGKVYQYMLLAGFMLWAVIVGRGVWPYLRGQDLWALPNWLFYSILSVLLLFGSGFVATPTTNFVISDFWRWCVIHMWVESFFEVFTTVLVAYFMVMMGLSSRAAAVRVVYLATLLFLGSGLLGISHNFYWNAKPVAAVAIGSVFSTLQVVPLILLALEAWRLRQLPAGVRAGSAGNGSATPASAVFGQSEAFLFLMAVNFWNFMGAGVMGFIINLPIVNYYEHGTYLTVNHGHAALMGVYGNLSIAAMIFCVRYLVQPAVWSERLLRCTFWSINLGLALMVLLDLFPAGVLQLQTVLEQGFWFARSQEFIQADAFQTLTWLRIIGGPLFVVGGVLSLTWFILRSWGALKPAVQLQAGAAPTRLPELPADIEDLAEVRS